MKIEKYRFIKNGKYEVIIDNNKYIIYEDVIVKNNLLVKKEITKSLLNDLIKSNAFYEAYYFSLKMIKNRLRTKKEIIEKLKKSEYPSDIISSVIERLEKEKYLNDDIYSKSYIHDMIHLKMIGPLKIIKDLEMKGISKDIVLNNIKVYTKDIEYEKLNKLITKAVSNNSNKSTYILKNKIVYDMLNKGFTKSYILDVIDSINIDDSNAYQKEYDKLYRKYSTKYSGNQLDYIIKQKLYSKGFKKN